MSKIDMKRESEKRFRSKLNRKHWRDYRLRELEKQLEFAESRCSALKQQLDYIKVIYRCGKPTLMENDEMSEIYDKEESRYVTGGLRRVSFDNLSRWNGIGGDVPEMGPTPDKHFIPHTISFTNTTRASTNSSHKAASSKSSLEKKEVIASDDPGRQKSRTKLTKGKRRKATTVSKHKLKSKGTEPRFNNATCQTLWQHPVVEIYKNTAANIESESAADLTYKNKRQKLDVLRGGEKSRGKKSSEQLIPPTKLKAFTSFKSLDKVQIVKEESVQTEQDETPVVRHERSASSDAVPTKQEKTSVVEPESMKSYCQPTISSKKKRVERNFLASLNSINLKNIPFIAATSTAPSHNIGVNIQQVLSIMKKRQPSASSNCGDVAPILSEHLIGDMPAIAPCSRGTNNISNISTNNNLNINDGGGGDGLTVTGTAGTDPDVRKPLDGTKSCTSQWKSLNKGLPCKLKPEEGMTEESDNPDWTCKVHKLKKVLVFLHEDFTSLSQKYKRLQKKLSKRNINKIDAKGELAEIERDLEKKEEEITIVIGLYKEVLHLREEVKKYQDKYNFFVYERALMMDGIKQSNSTHTQMSALLRKIQQFQDQLKR